MDFISRSFTPAITPAAYGNGDVIGELNTISTAVLENKAGGILDTITVLDKANQKSAIDLVFFNQQPVNSFGGDNAAYALNDADLDKLIGRISVAAADYVSSSTNNAEATLRNLKMLFQAYSGLKDIYCVVVSRGTPTYASASDLIVKVGIQQAP